MRKAILTLAALMVFSVLAIGGLYYLSDSVGHRKGSFIRQLPGNVSVQRDTFDLKYNSYYIAGVTSGSVYLGNSTNPYVLVRLNNSLRDIEHMKIENNFEKFSVSCRIAIDSPFFYVVDSQNSKLFEGTLSDARITKQHNAPTAVLDAVPLGDNSFGVRTIKENVYENSLAKLVGDSNTPALARADNVLQRQIDGIFCTDGMLRYNRELSKLIYVYYYRNEFIVMDNDLAIAYRGKTIDTTTRAKLQIADLQLSATRTLSAPPNFVNRKSHTSERFLYINSTVLAKNQASDALAYSSVIDVYDLLGGEYNFSFYLYNHFQQPLSDFAIKNRNLFTLYDHFIMRSELNKKYF